LIKAHLCRLRLSYSIRFPGHAGAGGARTLDEITKGGYLVVVTEDDFRPFEYIQDGKPVGMTTS
jgi:hypothetical protein